MNHDSLTALAIAHANQANQFLSTSMLRDRALAYIAMWLFQQDASTSATTVRATAEQSISDVLKHFS